MAPGEEHDGPAPPPVEGEEGVVGWAGEPVPGAAGTVGFAGVGAPVTVTSVVEVWVGAPEAPGANTPPGLEGGAAVALGGAAGEPPAGDEGFAAAEDWGAEGG
jgi:hypothetical protein